MKKFLIWNLPLWAMIPAIIAKIFVFILCVRYIRKHW